MQLEAADPESRIFLSGSHLGHQSSCHDPEDHQIALVFDVKLFLVAAGNVLLLLIVVGDLSVRSHGKLSVAVMSL